MAIPLVIGAISSVVSSWLDVKKAKNENTARLLREKESHNQAWEINSITHSPTGLRWLSFIIIYMPLIITVISPEHGRVIWENLEVVPEWYRWTCLAIIGAIWGISETKNMGFFK